MKHTDGLFLKLGREIAKKLDIPRSRVNSCVVSFEVVIGTPFEKIVVFGNRGCKRKAFVRITWW